MSVVVHAHSMPIAATTTITVLATKDRSYGQQEGLGEIKMPPHVPEPLRNERSNICTNLPTPLNQRTGAMGKKKGPGCKKR